LAKVFTIPTTLTYWYDLSDTTTVGSSIATLLQFKSKVGTYDGTISGSPAYTPNTFNSLSGGVTLSSTNYITMGTAIQAKYIVLVYKTPSAASQRLLYDTAGSGGAGARNQITFGTSGTSG